MAECQVCCDTYNKSNRKQVTCNYCEFDLCRVCATRFIMESPQDPHCMKCRHPWSLDFLLQNFTKKFVNDDLKLHRRQQLFERELSLLPATQPFVEQELYNRKRQTMIHTLQTHVKEAKKVLSEASLDLKPQYQNLFRLNSQSVDITRKMREKSKLVPPPAEELNSLRKQHKAIRTLARAQKKEIDDRLKPLEKVVKELSSDLYKLRYHPDPGAIEVKTEDSKEKRSFVRACPAENCRGFLSTQWKCGLCQVKVCSDCHEIKKPNQEHVCKPEDLETAKLLAKDSKPCPTCGALSIKVSGCLQVWCMSCHTAWNWKTGLVEKGAIHAADYYTFMERMRKTGRVHGDVPCGGMPDIYHVVYPLQRRGLMEEFTKQNIDIRTFHRKLLHMYNVDGTRMRPDANRDNRDLRIKYLLNEINDDQLKRQLQIREKALLKQREVYQIIQTTYEVASEAFRALTAATAAEEVQRLINELSSLMKYAADGCENISIKYNCVPYQIPKLYS